MCRLPNFVVQLLMAFAGLVFLVLSMAFVLLPYSLYAHPGEQPVLASVSTFHAT